jgi:hypothetical protein
MRKGYKTGGINGVELIFSNQIPNLLEIEEENYCTW